MQSHPLLFWHPGPNIKLSPAEIARELLWGEEVEGLIDLPIRQIIDRLKAEFPHHDEKSGLFTAHASPGSFQATWTWQHLRIDFLLPLRLGEGWGEGAPVGDNVNNDLAVEAPSLDSLRNRLIDAIESFDCMAYEPNS